MLKRLKRLDIVPLCLLLVIAAGYALLHAALGTGALGASAYNTYTLQALAWREGRAALLHDTPHLELAIYNGLWYVSFPPVPSIPLYLLTFLFGASTPDNLLVKLYASGACMILYCAFKRAGYSRAHSALLSVFTTFATCLLPLTLNGAVWYQAQTLAFLLTTAALALMLRDMPTPALLCYALAVGCRPFNVCYGFLLMYLHWRRHRSIKKLMPGVCAGLCVAALYAWYNSVRFGNPLEFGHNYLPEFSFQGGTQFSLAHVLPNIKRFILGMPLQNGQLERFGFSMFIASPILACLPVWAVRDGLRRALSWEKLLLLALFLAHLFLLLLHRTFGGFQFGARYTVDLIPYAAAYLCMEKRRVRVAVPVLCALALEFCVYGAFMVTL